MLMMAARDDKDRPAGPVKRGRETADRIWETRWWLARCHTGEEKKARDYLRGLDYAVIAPREVYLAKPSRYARGSGARIEREKAALPGWLVVGFIPGGPTWARFMVEKERIGYPRHGVRPLIVNDAPVRVHPRDAATLVALEDDPRLFPKGYQRWQHRRREYDAGDEVEFIEGPFAGQFASVQFIQEDGQVRVQLSVEVLGIKEVTTAGEALAKTR